MSRSTPGCRALSASCERFHHAGDRKTRRGSPSEGFGVKSAWAADALLLPTAAEGFVDLHEGEKFVEAGLREAKVGG